MPKAIVLGLNRTGTKLASLLIAQACGLQRVCLEPFSWDGGIDLSSNEPWENQRSARVASLLGQEEHRRLPVIADRAQRSPWMEDVLSNQGWDVVKFVEIGRCDLILSICAGAQIVGLIRDPVHFLRSLNGCSIQKDALAQQWKRLNLEEGFQAPLSDAGKWLPEALADCAQAYFILYTKLAEDLANHGLRTSYEKLTQEPDTWLTTISDKLGATKADIELSQVGMSTSKKLTLDQEAYVRDNLMSVYYNFLG